VRKLTSAWESGIRKNVAMAPLRRLGPFGIALTAFDLWTRLPPAHRRRLIKATRKHGPRVVRAAVMTAAARRARKGPR
jgi:hypothetical protein